MATRAMSQDDMSTPIAQLKAAAIREQQQLQQQQAAAAQQSATQAHAAQAAQAAQAHAHAHELTGDPAIDGMLSPQLSAPGGAGAAAAAAAAAQAAAQAAYLHTMQALAPAPLAGSVPTPFPTAASAPSRCGLPALFAGGVLSPKHALLGVLAFLLAANVPSDVLLGRFAPLRRVPFSGTILRCAAAGLAAALLARYVCPKGA